MKPQDMKIGQATAKFIECLQTMNSLYSEVSEALNMIYDKSQTVEIINERFWDEYKALEARIDAMVVDSIKHQLDEVDATEI